MSPPELAGDAPVADIVHPVEIGLLKSFRHELDFAAFHSRDGGRGERFHLHEPLLGHDRFDGRMAAVTGADVVRIRLDLDQISALFEFLDNRFAALVAFHPGEFAAVFVDVARVRIHAKHGQAVPLATSKSFGSCAWRNLHGARAEFHFAVFVAHDGDFAPTAGMITVLPIRCLYRGSFGFTATPVSPNMVSGRVVATVIE